MEMQSGSRFILFLIAIALLVILKQILVVIFLGILIGIVFSFPIGFLSKWMPRGLALLITLLVGGGFLTGVGYMVYQPISTEALQLKNRIPEAINRVRGWVNQAERSGALSPFSSNSFPSGSSSAAQPRGKQEVGSLNTSILSLTGQAAISLTSFLTALVIIVVLAAFFSHSPKGYQDGIRSLIPKENEPEFEELWKRLGKGLHHWLGGILISMTIMGILTSLGLLVAGIQDWFLLGMLTFFATFIPYIGALTSAIPGLIIGLAQSTEKFGAALIVYLCVHIVEGYLVEPLIMKRAVFIRPATLLIWQLLMGVLLGALGIVVATPLLVCVKVMVEYLYIENRLGKMKGA